MRAHMRANVSVFYKIPNGAVARMKMSELKANYINILYYNKHNKGKET